MADNLEMRPLGCIFKNSLETLVQFEKLPPRLAGGTARKGFHEPGACSDG